MRYYIEAHGNKAKIVEARNDQDALLEVQKIYGEDMIGVMVVTSPIGNGNSRVVWIE